MRRAIREYLTLVGTASNVGPASAAASPSSSGLAAFRDLEPRWAEFAAALDGAGCTRLARDLRSLQEAVDRYDALGGPTFWGDLLPFACSQALRYAELFPEPILIVDASAGAARGVSRVVEWSQAQCLCIQCNALLCSWPQRTSQNCRCTEREARSMDLPSINLDEMLCGAGVSPQANQAIPPLLVILWVF